MLLAIRVPTGGALSIIEQFDHSQRYEDDLRLARRSQNRRPRPRVASDARPVGSMPRGRAADTRGAHLPFRGAPSPRHGACSPAEPSRTLERPLVTSIRLRFLVACAALLVFSTPLLAQDPATASLAGLVTDPAGAAVANARVGVVSARTGTAREATSDARGAYLVTSLPPGAYTVTVEAAGFAPRRFETVHAGGRPPLHARRRARGRRAAGGGDGRGGGAAPSRPRARWWTT